MDDFEGSKTSVEEGTADMVGIEKKWNEKWSLKMWLDMQSHIKSWSNGTLISMDEQRKYFFEMESTPSKDAMKIKEMTLKGHKGWHKLDW